MPLSQQYKSGLWFFLYSFLFIFWIRTDIEGLIVDATGFPIPYLCTTKTCWNNLCVARSLSTFSLHQQQSVILTVICVARSVARSTKHDRSLCAANLCWPSHAWNIHLPPKDVASRELWRWVKAQWFGYVNDPPDSQITKHRIIDDRLLRRSHHSDRTLDTSYHGNFPATQHFSAFSYLVWGLSVINFGLFDCATTASC